MHENNPNSIFKMFIPVFLAGIVLTMVLGCGSKIPNTHGAYIETKEGIMPLHSYAKQTSEGDYAFDINANEYQAFTGMKSIIINIPDAQIGDCKIYADPRLRHSFASKWTVYHNYIDNWKVLDYSSKTIESQVYQLFLADSLQENHNLIYLKVTTPPGIPDRLYVFDLLTPINLKLSKKPETSSDYVYAYLQSFQQGNHDEFLRLNPMAHYSVLHGSREALIWLDSYTSSEVEFINVAKVSEQSDYRLGLDDEGDAGDQGLPGTDMAIFNVEVWFPKANKINSFQIMLIRLSDELSPLMSLLVDYKYAAGDWIVWRTGSADGSIAAVYSSKPAPDSAGSSQLPQPDVQKPVQKQPTGLEEKNGNENGDSSANQVEHGILESEMAAEPDSADLNLPEPDDFVVYDTEPTLISAPAPLYPEAALKAGITGTVWVKLLVDKSGNVREVVIAKDSGLEAGFEEAAMEAARKRKYKPALLNNQPVSVWVAYRVKFAL